MSQWGETGEERQRPERQWRYQGAAEILYAIGLDFDEGKMNGIHQKTGGW